MAEFSIDKKWFISTKQGDISKFYDINKKAMGQGSYGSVHKANLKGQKDNQRAVKIIKKNKIADKNRFTQEIEIMKKLDHPNIIKLYETFEDKSYVYLVMELCAGGELFDKIVDEGNFTESHAKHTLYQIMQGINYCHSNNICHRDLKPENFLLLNDTKNSPLKIIDFGLSTQYTEQSHDKMSTKAGTPYYISPEVLKGQYDESCDIWSAGVILYIVLSGVPPFNGDSDYQILQKVKEGKFTCEIPEFDGISNAAKDLIKQMIAPPGKRYNAQQVLQHPWFNSEIKESQSLANKLNFNALKQFNNQSSLKKVALTYIASQLSEKEINGLGEIFKSIDVNNDGSLTLQEIKEALVLQGASLVQLKQLDEIMNGIDTDHSGLINYNEFLAALIQKNVYLQEEKLYQTFKMLDVDGNGKITLEELKQVLGNSEDYSAYERMIKETDLNGDGEIDYHEFIAMMNQNSK